MLLTPQQVRERLVEMAMRSYQRAYGVADRALLERKVIAQLEMVDAATRGATPRPRPAPPAPRDLASKAAAENGMRLAAGGPVARARGVAFRPKFLYQNPMLLSERWGAACARVQRILAGSQASTLAAAVKTSESPRLAKKILDVFAQYSLRERPAPTGVDHNPFRHLSDVDAARMFMRRIEDICDESTRELGKWYVR